MKSIIGWVYGFSNLKDVEREFSPPLSNEEVGQKHKFIIHLVVRIWNEKKFDHKSYLIKKVIIFFFSHIEIGYENIIKQFFLKHLSKIISKIGFFLKNIFLSEYNFCVYLEYLYFWLIQSLQLLTSFNTIML